MRHRPTILILILILIALALVALALVATPALAGGGAHAGGGGGALCRGFAEGGLIDLDDNCFDGTGHEVAVGTTLTVRNRGQLPHTYTALDGSFDTGTIPAGGQAELTVAEVGVWQVYCTLHAGTDGWGMSGLLVVADDVAMAPASTSVSASAEPEPARVRPWWVLAGVVTTAAGAWSARRLIGTSP